VNTSNEERKTMVISSLDDLFTRWQWEWYRDDSNIFWIIPVGWIISTVIFPYKESLENYDWKKSIGL
jgi:hypothetical protein